MPVWVLTRGAAYRADCAALYCARKCAGQAVDGSSGVQHALLAAQFLRNIQQNCECQTETNYSCARMRKLSEQWLVVTDVSKSFRTLEQAIIKVQATAKFSFPDDLFKYGSTTGKTTKPECLKVSALSTKMIALFLYRAGQAVDGSSACAIGCSAPANVQQMNRTVSAKLALFSKYFTKFFTFSIISNLAAYA